MDIFNPTIRFYYKSSKIKRFFIFLTAFLILSSAQLSAADDNPTITLSVKNQKIQTVLEQVQKISPYRFTYRDIQLPSENNVSVTADAMPIETFLDKILAPGKLTFRRSGNTFAIVPNAKVQNITVTGTVIDKAGTPLPGVTVVLSDMSRGTSTDNQGRFSIEAPSNATIDFSYLGYLKQQVRVGASSTMKVTLLEDTKMIDDVVVVGYGTMRRSDLTGSIASISGDDITESKSLSFVNAMQGKVAGVQISSASGELGANSRISIRGANSIFGSSLPLYVIDGVQMDVNPNEIAAAQMGNGSQLDPMSSINPADIESIEVLKDASATAIYGSRGANGVIIVTTRSGKAGRGRIVYDGNVSFGQVTRKLDVLGASDFIDYRRSIDENSSLFYTDSNRDGMYNEFDEPNDPYTNPTHDWQDEMLRTAISHNHNLSLDGGTEKTQFSTSLGYTKNEGILINNSYNRITARAKVDHQASRRLKIGTNLNVSYSEYDGASQSGGEGGTFNGVVQSLVTSRPVEIYIPLFENTGTYVSPISMLESAYKKTTLMRSNINADATYKITDDLTFSVMLGGFLSSSKGNEFYGKNTQWGAGDNGRAMISEQRAYYISNTEQISYKKDFGKSRLDAMMAFEVNQYTFESFGVDNSNFIDESTGVYSISKGSVLKALHSYKGINNRLSYLARVYYDIGSRYLFTGSIRADGSDKFGPGNRYGYFPSLAAAWRISEEKFMKRQNVIDNLKLRLSYGSTGNERIDSYQYMANMENSYYNGVLGLAPLTLANENLKWESTAQYNAGIDLGMLNNRITVNFDIYKKITSNMLMPATIAAQSGFSKQWQNIGKVDNSGIEFMISTINIKNKNFEWSTNFNISRNKNVVKELGGVDFLPVSIGGGWMTNVGRVLVGEEIGTAYGYVFDGVYQMNDFTWQNGSDSKIPFKEREFKLKPGVVSVDGTNVKPGSFKFKNIDGSKDNVINENDQQVISRSSPKFFGGMTNTFKYKGFELSVFLTGSYGNQIFNESKFRLEGGVPLAWLNISQDFWENRWTPDNPTNEYGTFSVDTRNTTSRKVSSYYVEDASFLRLKTVSLSYTVPQEFLRKMRWSGISNVRVYVTGDNLYTWTKYTGFDPEIDSGIALLPGFDRISYPRTRSFIIGASLTF